MADLHGKVAFITGASSGIGAAVGRELVRRGARVALTARRTDRLDRLAGELGPGAIAITADVTNPESLRAAVEGTLTSFGRIDIAFANAGFVVSRPMERLTTEDVRRQFETNVFGVLDTLYATLPALKASRGAFAITGSVTSYLGLPGVVPYAMSKFAVRALAQGLRAELAASGVAVVLLSPGFVDSEIRQVDNFGRHRPDSRDTGSGWLSVPTDRAARAIVRAISRRRREAVITTHGKAVVLVARHMPRLSAWLLRRAARARPRR